MTQLLEMRGIVKRFPGVLANDRVDFDLRAGEVHTLLGENGAGKSTLMNILYGLYQPDEGELLIEGSPTRITSPIDAINHGIGMVHQHFMLVPTLTVTENVAMGAVTSKRGRMNLRRVADRIRELSESHGLAVDPDAYIWQLSVGERQRVEIIRALYRDVKLLVLDEPTAVLTPGEVEHLFKILRQMAQAGRGLVFISHKLHEVLALSDRITVLRHGRVMGEVNAQDATREMLASMMVGRPVRLAPDKPPLDPGRARLTIRNLSVMGDRGLPALEDLNLSVREGEILGIAGVSGNGQRELAETIAGLRKPTAGAIEVDGADITGHKPSSVRGAGLAYVPEERQRDGAIGAFSVSENLILVNHNQAPMSRRGFLRNGEIRQRSRQLVDEFSVATPGLDVPASNLSGGNLQKLILARELSGSPSVLVASQPTRGVDIGAAEYIHDRLIEQRGSKSVAILLISEDLDEILGLADRIAVIYEGRIVGEVGADRADRQQIGLMMAGVSNSDN